jgi:predicted PurR-regulated permease PerM
VSDEKAGHRIFIERLVIAIAIVGFALLLWSLRSLFMLVFGALLVAVILNVIAAPLHERLRLPQRVALLASVLILAGLFASAAWIFGAEVTRQAESLRQSLPGAWTALEARLDAWALGDALRDLFNNVWSGGSLGAAAISVGNAVGATFLMLVAGVYLAARPDLYRTGIIKLVPPGGRPLAADAIDDTARALRLWLLGRIVSMVAVAFLTWLGLGLIGVPSALTLALLAGLLEFVPYVGPIVSAVPAVLLAFAASPEMAVWTALLFFGVQQFEGYVLEPLVQQRAVDLPPALLLFALVGGGLVFGLIGVLFAEPLTVMLFVMVKRLYVREALRTATPIPGENN